MALLALLQPYRTELANELTLNILSPAYTLVSKRGNLYQFSTKSQITFKNVITSINSINDVEKIAANFERRVSSGKKLSARVLHNNVWNLTLNPSELERILEAILHLINHRQRIRIKRYFLSRNQAIKGENMLIWEIRNGHNI